MIFTPATLDGAFLIDIERKEDERGYFARVMCRDEFSGFGLIADFVQANHSFNRRQGTLRGMHMQASPHAEVKLVRCVRGAIYDVIIDLRTSSPSYLRWEGFELSADNGRLLYIPEGFAHGFQTLCDETDVTYQVSHPYTPSAERGVRYNDPTFSIGWPLPVTAISSKDASWPDFEQLEAISA